MGVKEAVGSCRSIVLKQYGAGVESFILFYDRRAIARKYIIIGIVLCCWRLLRSVGTRGVE